MSRRAAVCLGLFNLALLGLAVALWVVGSPSGTVIVVARLLVILGTAVGAYVHLAHAAFNVPRGGRAPEGQT